MLFLSCRHWPSFWCQPCPSVLRNLFAQVPGDKGPNHSQPSQPPQPTLSLVFIRPHQGSQEGGAKFSFPQDGPWKDRALPQDLRPRGWSGGSGPLSSSPGGGARAGLSLHLSCQRPGLSHTSLGAAAGPVAEHWAQEICPGWVLGCTGRGCGSGRDSFSNKSLQLSSFSFPSSLHP